MTPENVAGLEVPHEQLRELIDALAEAAEPKFELELPKAA
jgi:2'-5' RNA ligase